MLNGIVGPEIASLAQTEIQKYGEGKSYCSLVFFRVS